MWARTAPGWSATSKLRNRSRNLVLVLQSVKNELVVLQNPNKLHILIYSRRVLATVLAAKWLLSRAVQEAESRADLLRNQNKERGLCCKGLASIQRKVRWTTQRARNWVLRLWGAASQRAGTDGWRNIRISLTNYDPRVSTALLNRQ